MQTFNYLTSIIILTLTFQLLLVFPLQAQWNGLDKPMRYPLAGNIRSIGTGDITGDQRTDILVMYPASETKMGLLAGNGDGTFQTETFQAKEEDYHLFELADLNGDGYSDLVISSYWNNGFKVCLADAHGNFTPGTYYYAGVHGRAVKLVDINKDGHLDIVAITTGSGQPITLHLFKGDGTGNFAAKSSYPSVLHTNRDTYIFDKNNDGLLDVMVTSSFAWFVIFYQQADGRFIPRYWPTSTPARVSVADFNNDKQMDALFAYSSFDNGPDSDSLVIKAGEPDTLFRFASVKLPYQKLRPYQVVAADMNQDGNMDVLFSHLHPDGALSDTLYYLPGKGDFTFETPQAVVMPDSILSFQVAQLNADSFPDLIVSCKGEQLAVLLNKGSDPTGREDPEEGLTGRIYPNPTSGKFRLDLPSQPYHITITDILGRIVQTGHVSGGRTEMETDKWPAGVYLVHIRNTKGQSITQKLIRQ